MTPGRITIQVENRERFTYTGQLAILHHPNIDSANRDESFWPECIGVASSLDEALAIVGRFNTRHYKHDGDWYGDDELEGACGEDELILSNDIMRYRICPVGDMSDWTFPDDGRAP